MKWSAFHYKNLTLAHKEWVREGNREKEREGERDSGKILKKGLTKRHKDVKVLE